ncbi:MAG: pyruvate, orthophosphate dikinase [Chloroflexia bacterium]|jgi:pyruvate,orthophosphate dikinase|nr:pyruvate, orthophosphate dikinase [Chloroflexia bacterium]
MATTMQNEAQGTNTGHKWVYLFHEGNAKMRDLLGGKGAGLSEMTNAGLPVPPGFTITTEACRAYLAGGKKFPEGMWEQALEALHTVEGETGKRLGDPANPLLVSVRSGAKFSMPGMMDTVLNLGLSPETLQGLVKLTGNERFAHDAYRRFIQLFGRIVMGVEAHHFDELLDGMKEQRGVKLDTELTAEDLRELVEQFKQAVQREAGRPFPDDPHEQLRLAIEAVFGSWNSPRAFAYRNAQDIPHDLGTAVNVVMMVFGNMGEDSGTGVAFTRNPSTGESKLYGEFLVNAQGEDVVAGIRTPQKIAQLEQDMPEVYNQFVEIGQRLEKHYRDMQDLEFTVERGKLYMLQTRSGKRTAAAAVKIAVDMVSEGLISREEAIQRVEPDHVVQLLLGGYDQFDKERAIKEGKLLAVGLNAAPGAAVGQAIFTADKAAELGKAGVPVVLVREETNPEDVHGMIAAKGVLTARGGATSHAAVVARQFGKVCVAGAENGGLHVDDQAGFFTANGQTVREGEIISIDGTTGEVFLGAIALIEPNYEEEHDLVKLLSWADDARKLGVWANADYPRDAQKAVAFGAEGIGLCRTEHMFFEEVRLPVVRQMILSAAEATRLEDAVATAQTELNKADEDKRGAAEEALHKAQQAAQDSRAVHDYRDALDQLGVIQQGDFYGILKAMEGKPTVIRLLDPPLHEFLPSYEDLLVQTTEMRVRGETDSEEYKQKEHLLGIVGQMREQNPMLGLRGCRLGILYPAINEMQVRAILQASLQLLNEGLESHPEIMIPLVGHVNELKVVRDLLEKVARDVVGQAGREVPYKFGTMIEVPRAALTAGQIAEYAEFFSFGTNDLTQTTYGYSRDDAEGKFLLQYVEREVLPENPFQVLDRQGVGRLVKIAVEEGRKTRPDLKVGICGEHGGDPSSIQFCHEAGLNYVSCSPYRVPVARLAAAQAALTAGAEKDK